MKTELMAFAEEIRQMYQAGDSLRQIAAYSFAQRESGRNVPYLAIAEQDGNVPMELRASPTAKQKALSAFFSEKAPGCVAHKRFILRVSTFGVFFQERVSKTEIINLV